MGLLSIGLGRFLGWRGRDLHEFGIAALIHDVGKLYTPLEILNQPGRLTPQEWVVMKKQSASAGLSAVPGLPTKPQGPGPKLPMVGVR